jgi:hypothetical protein
MIQVSVGRWHDKAMPAIPLPLIDCDGGRALLAIETDVLAVCD